MTLPRLLHQAEPLGKPGEQIRSIFAKGEAKVGCGDWPAPDPEIRVAAFAHARMAPETFFRPRIR